LHLGPHIKRTSYPCDAWDRNMGCGVLTKHNLLQNRE